MGEIAGDLRLDLIISIRFTFNPHLGFEFIFQELIFPMNYPTLCSLYQEASELTFVLGNVHQRNRVGNHIHGMVTSVFGTINVCFLSSEEEGIRLKEDIDEFKEILERANVRDFAEDVNVRATVEGALRAFISRWSEDLVPPVLRMLYLSAAQEYDFGTSVPILAECILGNWGNVVRPSCRPVDNPDWIKARLFDDRILCAMIGNHDPFLDSPPN